MGHSVYVIELDKEVLKSKKFRDDNPDMDPKKACFYVGQTAKTPDERFEDHKRGHKSNRYAKKYGLWLRRRKYKRFNPINKREDAIKKEKELAERLKRKGHGVWYN